LRLPSLRLTGRLLRLWAVVVAVVVERVVCRRRWQQRHGDGRRLVRAASLSLSRSCSLSDVIHRCGRRLAKWSQMSDVGSENFFPSCMYQLQGITGEKTSKPAEKKKRNRKESGLCLFRCSFCFVLFCWVVRKKGGGGCSLRTQTTMLGQGIAQRELMARLVFCE
jgi:hypothetical protein